MFTRHMNDSIKPRTCTTVSSLLAGIPKLVRDGQMILLAMVDEERAAGHTVWERFLSQRSKNVTSRRGIGARAKLLQAAALTANL